MSRGRAVLEAGGSPGLQVTGPAAPGQCVTRPCVRASPPPAAPATGSSPTSRRTPAAPATAVVRGPGWGWGGAGTPITQGRGAWLALGMTGFWLEMKAGLGWGPRHGHAGSAPNPEILFPPECDPDLCEAVQVPSCRQDQILIAGRLGDACCISYFCGG